MNDRIPHVPIRSFAKTKDNLLLVGADGAGVFCMDVATGELLNHYMNNGDDDKSLSGNTVSDICVDESGVVWIGTSTNGISYLDPEMPDVYRIRHERNNDNSLKSDHVNVMFQDSEGDYWYGTNNGVSSINLGHANGLTIWTVRNIVAKWYWRLPKTPGETSGRWLWYRCLLYS